MMLSGEFERTARQRIEEIVSAKRDAESRLQAAQDAITEQEEQLANWQAVLKDYRERNGLPPDNKDIGRIVAHEYLHLGPSAMVRTWAAKHGGHISLKEVSALAVQVGAYRNKKQAYNVLQSTVGKSKEFQRIGPGEYQLKS